MFGEHGLLKMAQTHNKKRTALITGASEGIGLELAKLMAAEGWDLVVTARRENLLNELAEKIRTHHKSDVHVIPGDLSDHEEPDKLYNQVVERGVLIDALINNAGFGMVGLFKDADQERVKDMLNVNMVSLTRLTSLFLPDLLRKGLAWILNVSSIAGFISMPYFAAYAASKAYVISFSEALSSELEGTGVSVSCLCPGPTKTGFGRVAGYNRPNRYEPGTLDARTVARQGYEAMMAGKRIVTTGPLGTVAQASARFLPRKLAADVSGKVMSMRMK